MWKSALQILQMPEESPSLVRVYLSTTSWSTPLLTSFLWWMRSRFLRSVLHQNSANFSENNSDSSLKWKSQVKFPSGISTQCADPRLDNMYVMYPTPAANEFQFCWVCGVLLHQRSFHDAPEQIGFECLSILPTYLLDMNVQCGLWFQFIAQQ